MTDTTSPAPAQPGPATAAPLPAGYTTLTPFLVIQGARAAIDFYVSVFGATVVSVMDLPGGGVAHAELDFGAELGAGRLQLSDPNPDYGLVAAPASGDSVTHLVAIYVLDVDAVVARAEAAGARIREPVTTFVTGDRFGSVLDPFGQRWAVMTRVEEVSPEETERRLAEWGKDNL